MPHSTNEVLSRCAKSLYDEENDDYTLRELLVHLNSATNEIVQFDPKAFILNMPFLCVPGTLQQLTGDAIAIIDVIYNTDSSGTQGRRIRECDYGSLVRARPNMDQSPPSAVTRNYAADPRDPKRFYLWPPRPATPGYVQAIWQSVPDDMFLEQQLANGTSNPGQRVITLASTNGISVGQTASVGPDPTDPNSAIVRGATVASIVPGTSVTLSTNLNSTITSGTLVTFGDLFSLPDLYEEAAYLFTLYHVLNREDKKGNPTKAMQYYAMFLKALDQDIKDITSIQAGSPRVST